MTLVQLGKGLLRPFIRHLRRDRAAQAIGNSPSASDQSGSLESSPAAIHSLHMGKIPGCHLTPKLQLPTIGPVIM
jgi:hypothetical protein